MIRSVSASNSASAVRRALVRIRPRGVLVGNPYIFEGAAACRTAAAHGVPVAAIEHGSLTPGSLLGNEIELAGRLGLSRPTVRQAIQSLVDKGLLVRRRGVGTQVVHSQVKRPLELSSLYDDLEAAGAAIPAGFAAEQLRRLDVAGERLEGNVSPELVIDALAIGWAARPGA